MNEKDLFKIPITKVEKEILKRKIEKSFFEYVKWSFEKKNKKPFVVNSHHIKICETLEKVFSGEIENLIINIAPRYSKTEIAVKCFIEWCLAKINESKFIHLTYSDSLALDSSSEIRENIKSDWYQYLWPSETKKDKDSKQKWETTNGGGVYATGTMGSITGFGAGRFDDNGFGGAIIIDDPLKPDEAHSEDIRKKANQRLNSTIINRRNNTNGKNKTPIIIIMQRIHEEDMTGFCLSGGTDLKWHHVSIPVIDENGKALWEAKHSIEQLNEMKRADPQMFSGQYMQSPSPQEGNMIKRSWIKTYTVLPQIEQFWISLDCSFKESEKSDFVVFQVWGRRGAEYFLIDRVRDKMDFPTTLSTFEMICNKHKYATAKLVEVKANGQAIVDSLKKKISGIIEITPTESKEARLSAVSPLFQAGNVYLREDDYDFIEELVTFPKAKHDDMVDACSQALKYGEENKGFYFGCGVVRR